MRFTIYHPIPSKKIVPEKELDSKMSKEKKIEERDDVVIRFAGDSGDGMQLTGSQFTSTTAIVGNDLSTFPDYPSEIRAPAGTLAGVSGFQINFSSRDIRTHGDTPSVLVAMNPAALKTNIKDLEHGGLVIANADAFTPQNLQKAKYEENPLENDSLKNYQLYPIPITSLTLKAVEGVENLSAKEGERTKNFYALGLMYWLYDRPLDVTLKWIQTKFKKAPHIVESNTCALKAGYYYGETTEMFSVHYHVPKASLEPGTYRNITGNEATALGSVTASQLAGKPLLYASYPITPASEILQELSRYKKFDVKTVQAEDEIAAAGVALGASFAGGLGLTGTSGPGLALKSEMIGLAVMTELPLVIVNVQRGGPSTGLPTKVEQSDLFQSVFGRHGECPLPILAAATPGDCFHMSIEAFRLAIKYMTPVLLLSDGYLANGAEPWKIPELKDLPKIPLKYWTDPEGFAPYRRDPETLARPWTPPGIPGLEHRIGGLEKEDISGNVSHDPHNHQKMVQLRAEKVERIVEDIPDIEVFGKDKGELLIVGWGSTYGAITSATEYLQKQGESVSSIHLRYLYPMPKNLGDILDRFNKIMIPELNMGQLAHFIRSKFLCKPISLSKIQGKPFMVREIVDGAKQLLEEKGEVKNLWPQQTAALSS